MSWITIVWSMNAAACLTLAGIYLLVWCKQREGWAYLVLSCNAVAGAALIAFEAGVIAGADQRTVWGDPALGAASGVGAGSITNSRDYIILLTH
jgi:hypothetical protein